ncbi:MAG: D-xylose ABC transporter ATP-binding protein [Candidatus Nephthysia bennettiae]|uniref:Sugar ABC transporter ATP-binding protein n=1 Tax=Candidatus Nephthysia bennettiae TaxID=3127016 RepID=A0A934N8P7_9BACT|nr:sugar ABC transporter ATP-binding protein [Candidatus Dormibacteraeota bacterium]MBJ7613560.1 sugar ABC transporter ATP-binding protein [Candidatus Dormibacteraeota bacterium]PZR87374.1 MAG: D-xylose ABC transporter ATP-binding protein [Candidatus Dormibacteraeota bacterium]
MTAPLLSVTGVSKSYGAYRALNGVDFVVHAGQAVAVIGENGAGKSTFAKILAGVIRPDSGSILLEGEEVRFSSPRDALRRGVAFIPQELAYLPNMSVAENILVGRWPNRLGITNGAMTLRQARSAARQFGIDLDLKRSMAQLTLGERQLVEIVKVLARRARLIILDEPTASLSDQESRILFGVLKRLAGQGVGFVYISHRMDEVYRFSDRVDVFRNGVHVAAVEASATTPAKLIEYMLGQAGEQLPESSPRTGSAERRLQIVDWRADGVPILRGVNIEVGSGEIVGVFGLRGAGQELIAEGLAGLHNHIHGELVVDGRRSRVFTRPRQAGAAHISYVPAERKRNGLVLSLSIRANLTLLILAWISRFGIRVERLENRRALELAKRLSIRYRSLSQKTGELSGGNQQKVMVGSRLARQPTVFVLQEPTRGVDVGARVEIHKFLRELTTGGAAILLVTSDVEEAVIVSDRLLIMREGSVAAELTGLSKTQSQALAIATASVS